MTLKNQMGIDARMSILDTDELAESICYTPYGGTQKTIKAIVVREPLQSRSIDENRTSERQCQIHIANDATDGITAVTVRFDKVAFPIRPGETAVSWVVGSVVSKDDGMWHLMVTGG